MRRLGFAIVCAVGMAFAASADRAASDTSETVAVYQTTQNLSQRMAHLPDLAFSSSAPAAATPVIDVNDAVGYQHIAGFGAAMTDTSGWLIERELSPAQAQSLLADLFGSSGIHLNFLRIPIGASDFTSNGRPYSYDDLPSRRVDPQLKHFSIAHDQAYLIPALRQVLADNPGLETLAVPWSPPGWMKANGSLDNRYGRGTLLRMAYTPLASYLVRFIKAYAAQGIPIDAIAPQNEPTIQSTYPGLNLDQGSEARLISMYLAPALRAARLGTKIYGHDIGWGGLWRYADGLATGSARNFINGISWHCYSGPPTVMSAVHAHNPGLDELVDECSPGITYFPVAEVMIAAMRNWASALALWNLALDPKGGPVQRPNSGCPNCTGVVTIDERRHSVKFNRAYYQLGQASAFVAPGSQRIASNNFVRYQYNPPRLHLATPGLDDIAFRNPDGSEVLMAYNGASRPVTFAVRWHGQAFTYTAPASATVTFVWG